MKGLPSHGIRSSWRWSDSQKVQPSGKIAISAMTASAGSTSVQPRRASDPSLEIFFIRPGRQCQAAAEAAQVRKECGFE